MLQKTEYMALIADLNVDITLEQANRYFSAMDSLNKDEIEYLEFEVAFVKYIAALMVQSILNVFFKESDNL